MRHGTLCSFIALTALSAVISSPTPSLTPKALWVEKFNGEEYYQCGDGSYTCQCSKAKVDAGSCGGHGPPGCWQTSSRAVCLQYDDRWLGDEESGPSSNTTTTTTTTTTTQARVTLQGPPARCSGSSSVMPSSFDACKAAAAALGREIENYTGVEGEHGRTGPLCAYDGRLGASRVRWNAEGTADSVWGGNEQGWLAVCVDATFQTQVPARPEVLASFEGLDNCQALRSDRYVGVKFFQQTVVVDGKAACGQLPRCSTLAADSQTQTCSLHFSFVRKVSHVSFLCYHCSHVTISGKTTSSTFKINREEIFFGAVANEFGIFNVSIWGAGTKIDNLTWKEAAGTCRDDPDGIVAAVRDKDCRDIQPDSETTWSCQRHNHDTEGREYFVWQLCPLSCGECLATSTSTTATTTTTVKLTTPATTTTTLQPQQHLHSSHNYTPATTTTTLQSQQQLHSTTIKSTTPATTTTTVKLTTPATTTTTIKHTTPATDTMIKGTTSIKTATNICGECGDVPCMYCDSMGCCVPERTGSVCKQLNPVAEVTCQDPGCPRHRLGECFRVINASFCMPESPSVAAVYHAGNHQCCQFRYLDDRISWSSCPNFHTDSIVIGPKLTQNLVFAGDYSIVKGREQVFLAECSARLVSAQCIDVVPGSIIVTVAAADLGAFKAAKNRALNGGSLKLPSFDGLELRQAGSTENQSATEVANDMVNLLNGSRNTNAITVDLGKVMIVAQELMDDVKNENYAAVAVKGSSAAASLPRSLLQKLGGRMTVCITAEKDFQNDDGTKKQADRWADFSELPARNKHLAAPLVSVRIWRSGNWTEVRDLTKPVLIKVLDKKPPGARCVFWNETEKQWSTSGVKIWETADNSLTCASTHLTLFSAIVEQFTEQLECTNIQALWEGLDELGSAWLLEPPGVIFLLLLLIFCILLIGGCLLDSHYARAIQWQDKNFVINVPQCNRQPLRLSYLHLLCASMFRSCQCTTKSAMTWCKTAWDTNWEEFVMIHLSAAGVHSVLAVRSGFAVETLRNHLWNSSGWIRNDLASLSSSEFAGIMYPLRKEVSQAFLTFFGSMSWMSRVQVLFRALHPFAGISFYCIEISSAKRAKLKADIVMGAMAISALFFSASGSAISIRSPAECADAKASALRFILIGLFSASFVSIPVSVVRCLIRRIFVDHSQLGPKTLQRQLHWWLMLDVVFWATGSIYSFSCLWYIALLSANLNAVDHWKWVLTCTVLLLRVLLLQPLAVSMLLASAASVVRWRRPEFVSQGHPRLHLSLQVPKPVQVGVKVKELANRSISIQELMTFWRTLRPDSHAFSPMPHFDPSKSTSSDVVRQAVIPLSCTNSLPVLPSSPCNQMLRHDSTASASIEALSGTGVAYATMMAPEQEHPPDVMVTHNWGNVYSHLFAAVVSESLGHRTYESTARCLADGQLSALEVELGPMRLQRRYWICCFCVNQHSSICGKPPATDSHGVRIERCCCLVKKQWSGEDCEIDKFDDMMSYLTDTVATFSQMVAVDIHFKAFTRVWCIAELVEAKKKLLPQVLIIHSESILSESLKDIEKFDVRDAKASVAQDKERILAKIEDFDAFNDFVRQLLLSRDGGLLTAAMALDFGGGVFAGESVNAAAHVLVDGAELPGVIF